MNQAAARMDRASKRYDRAAMRERALVMDARYDHQARRAVEQALERGRVIRAEQEINSRAQEAVTFARDNAMEREAVADWRKVIVDALRRNLALTTYEAVRAELAARLERGEFVAVTRERRPREATTERMLRLEKENIQTVLDGRGKLSPMMEEGRARQVIAEAADRRGLKLNEGQQSAVEQLLTTSDQITGLQGGAGTGKTTVLAALKESAESVGYEVRGFAPTTRAAQLLAESGIEAQTLQKFLRGRAPAHSGEMKRLFVLDESSLASTQNLHRFFARLGPEDRVLMVGDTRQHQAIEAGSPFEQLQRRGMETARLTEIVRQRDPELRQTIEKLSISQVREAVGQLQSQGRVVEVADDRKRLQVIAADYCRQPEGALVISPANRERAALNALIHEKLKAEGKISRQGQTTKVYVARQDMTGTERTFANSYVPGEDIIRYNRASRVYGVKVGDYARVIETNYEQNTITVRTGEGREITYNPARLSGVSVYREAERTFAEGDRVQFRAPLAERRIANGELGTIEKIEGENFTVVLDGGKSVSFDAGAFRHLDHGYAVTSYSSQSQTVERVIVNADTRESELLLNQRMGYVALSRAKEEATVYTNSKEELSEALDRRVDKEMALEATERAKSEQGHFGKDAKARDFDQALTHDPKVDNVSHSQNLGAEANGADMAAGHEITFDLSL